MTDDHQHAGEVDQEVLQPSNGVQVKVVGRLIEKQSIRISEQRLRKKNPQLQPARQLGHRPFVKLFLHSKSSEQLRGIRLRGVPILLGDDHLQLAELVILFIGKTALVLIFLVEVCLFLIRIK